MSESLEQAVARAVNVVNVRCEGMSRIRRSQHFVAALAGALEADGSQSMADRLMEEILGHEPKGKEQ